MHLEQTVFYDIIFYFFSFQRHWADAVPVSFWFFIYTGVVLHYYIIKKFFCKYWLQVVIRINIYKIAYRIYTKLAEIKMDQLIFYPPCIAGNRYMKLGDLQRINYFQLRFFCKQQVETVDAPVVFTDVDNARKQRLVASFGCYADAVDFFSVFPKTAKVFVFIKI